MSCDSIIVPANNFINRDSHLLLTVYFLPVVFFMTGIIFIIVYLPGIFVNNKTMFCRHPLKNSDRCNITTKPCCIHLAIQYAECSRMSELVN